MREFKLSFREHTQRWNIGDRVRVNLEWPSHDLRGIDGENHMANVVGIEITRVIGRTADNDYIYTLRASRTGETHDRVV